MEHAAKASSALSAGDFPTAITHYSDAIAVNPEAVDYYIKRSTAHTRLSPPDHNAAFNDAEVAVVLATKRAKRELIAQAQLRRAIALFGLERYADAQKVLQWSRKFNEKEKTLPMWEMKIGGRLKDIAEGDERLKSTVSETPEVAIPQPEKGSRSNQTKASSSSQASNETAPPAQHMPQIASESSQTPAKKIRHDWYQSNDTVTVTVFAKGVPKDKATVNILRQAIEISFPLDTGSDFDLSFDPLFSEIDVKASSYKIMSTKIEFQLKKASAGFKWGSLEGSGRVHQDETASSRPEDASIKRAVLGAAAANSAPSYPTSSRSGPKDWDKVASDLTKKSKKSDKESEDGGEHEGGVDEDDEEADPVNGFFKKLYKDADPDTRRAMMKSYQESNGTALSTNWSEVGKGPVETSPPEGMEAKNW